MGTVLQSAGSVTGALLATLAAVAIFATLGWLAVRLVGRRGLRWGRRGGELEVVERLPLDFKSSLYVVRGMGRTWLIGCGDHGGPRLLTELTDDAQAPATPSVATAREPRDG